MGCNKKFRLDVNGHLMVSSSSAFSSFGSRESVFRAGRAVFSVYLPRSPPNIPPPSPVSPPRPLSLSNAWLAL